MRWDKVKRMATHWIRLENMKEDMEAVMKLYPDYFGPMKWLDKKMLE